MLIHRGLKLQLNIIYLYDCLRAVLIHRGLKPTKVGLIMFWSLRAVLIHRGLKLKENKSKQASV